MKKIITTLAIFLFCNSSVIASNYDTQNKTYLTNIKQAQKYEALGNIKMANDYYKKADEIFPSRFESSFGLAKTYGWLNNKKNSEIYFKTLLKQYPNNTAIMEQYAYFLKDSGNYQDALKEFEALFDKTKQSRFKTNIAEIYYLAGQYNKAINILSTLDLKNPKNLALLANSYFNNADYKNAQIYLKKELAYNKSAETEIKYAKSLFYSGNASEAKIVLEKLNPSEDINLTMADVYLSLKEFEKASNLLESLLKNSPNDINLKIKYANSLMALNNFEKANTIASEVLSIQPENKEAINTYVDSCFAMGKFKPASQLLQQQITKFPNDYTLQIKYAKSLMAQGKMDDAQNILKKIADENKDNNEALKGLADIYYLKENYLSSIKTLENIEKDDETNVLLAKNYNKLLKGSTALNILKDNSSEEAKKLRSEIKRENAFQFSPIFESGNKSGNVNQNLSYQRYGFEASQTIFPDIKAYARFAITPYKAMDAKGSNTVNSYTIGSSGKIGLKTDYLTEVTLDTFSNGGVEVLGKAVAGYKANDKFNIKAGFIRSLVDETLLSSVGLTPTTGPFKDQLVGRIIDNKLVFDTSFKLPHDSYIYAGYHAGSKEGQNSSANLYQEIMGGIGKLVYSADENKLLSQVITGYNIYYTGYQENKLDYGGVSLENTPLGSDGGNYSNTGGYFSPQRFIMNNFSLKLKGSIKKLNLKYQNESFAGIQNMKDYGSAFTWGNTISLIWNEEGRVGVKAGYNTNFYGVATHQNLFVQLIINDLFGRAKCSESL